MIAQISKKNKIKILNKVLKNIIIKVIILDW
jgi:hypothetical protein